MAEHDNSFEEEEGAMQWVMRRDLVGDTSVHEVGPLRIVGASLRVALASGFTWGAGALAAALMACWGLGAWVVLPVALFATFVIALVVNSARMALDADAGGGAIMLPDPGWFSDVPTQSLVRRLTAARDRLDRATRESPRGPTFEFAQVPQSAAEIERRVIVLLARAEYVASFLSSTSIAEINAALERARARERAAADGEGASMYRRLIDGYERHLQSVRALESEKERLMASAEHLICTLEAFPASLTRLQCMRLAIGDEDATKRSVQGIAAVGQSLSALEEALQEERAAAD